MVVDTSKETLNINKVVCENKEVIFVEGDVIVPDAKPDILNTINTSGTICIYKKELLDEKIRIDGNINAYIMYLADNAEDNVRGININLDFSENLKATNSKQGMSLETDINIKSIDCNVINGRKINVKVGIEVKFKVYSNEEVNLISNIQNNKDIQVLEKRLKVNSLVGSGSTKVYVKDTIMVDNADNLAEILKTNINMVDRDIKISYNKVLAKTEAEIKIMYLTEENKISTITNKIPVVGFLDIQNVTEENICDVKYEIKNLVLKPNSVEEHSIYIELETEVSCMAYEEREISLIQDLYSTMQEMSFEQKQIQTITSKSKRKETYQIREKINMPELENHKVIDIDSTPNIIKVTKLNSRIMYEGELNLKFILLNTTGGVNIKNIIVPFEYTLEDIQAGEGLDANTSLELENSDFIIQSQSEVDCGIDIIFNVNMSRNVSLNIIDNIITEDSRDNEDYSLIIYIVKEGDSLWNIAKRFKSTVDDIVRTNGIEDPDVIHIGDKLYIPKYVRKELNRSEESSDVLKYA